ncbi:hypothetical protein XELAEV_18037472mg [Xenopus laevis]|uniref:PH domain-containing protein n=1 Tax=Xenopus laevis TaxID=8355 RepID=A0A974HA74_XENLA|nr:hypothetical protein XELAEV_18037472mg [Xenopus laevis]
MGNLSCIPHRHLRYSLSRKNSLQQGKDYRSSSSRRVLIALEGAKEVVKEQISRCSAPDSNRTKVMSDKASDSLPLKIVRSAIHAEILSAADRNLLTCPIDQTTDLRQTKNVGILHTRQDGRTKWTYLFGNESGVGRERISDNILHYIPGKVRIRIGIRPNLSLRIPGFGRIQNSGFSASLIYRVCKNRHVKRTQSIKNDYVLMLSFIDLRDSPPPMATQKGRGKQARGYKAGNRQLPAKGVQDFGNHDIPKDSVDQRFLSIFRKGKKKTIVRNMGQMIHYSKVKFCFQNSQDISDCYLELFQSHLYFQSRGPTGLTYQGLVPLKELSIYKLECSKGPANQAQEYAFRITGPLLNPLSVYCSSQQELQKWLYHLEKQIQLNGGNLDVISAIEVYNYIKNRQFCVDFMWSFSLVSRVTVEEAAMRTDSSEQQQQLWEVQPHLDCHWNILTTNTAAKAHKKLFGPVRGSNDSNWEKSELRRSVQSQPVQDWEETQRESLGSITCISKVKLQTLPFKELNERLLVLYPSSLVILSEEGKHLCFKGELPLKAIRVVSDEAEKKRKSFLIEGRYINTIRVMCLNQMDYEEWIEHLKRAQQQNRDSSLSGSSSFCGSHSAQQEQLTTSCRSSFTSESHSKSWASVGKLPSSNRQSHSTTHGSDRQSITVLQEHPVQDDPLSPGYSEPVHCFGNPVWSSATNGLSDLQRGGINRGSKRRSNVKVPIPSALPHSYDLETTAFGLIPETPSEEVLSPVYKEPYCYEKSQKHSSGDHHDEVNRWSLQSDSQQSSYHSDSNNVKSSLYAEPYTPIDGLENNFMDEILKNLNMSQTEKPASKLKTSGSFQISHTPHLALQKKYSHPVKGNKQLVRPLMHRNSELDTSAHIRAIPSAQGPFFKSVSALKEEIAISYRNKEGKVSTCIGPIIRNHRDLGLYG